MGFTYNKNIPKDRIIVSSGPRDRQLKHARDVANSIQGNSGLVSELRSQIEKLNKQLEANSASMTGYTASQVDDEIIKAIKAETANMKSKQDAELSILKSKIESINLEMTTSKEVYEKEVSSLKDIINSKDDMIKQLLENKQPTSDNKLIELLGESTKKIEAMAAQISMNTTGEMPDSGRPKMETVFVDPIENESKVEKHFDIEDISVKEKIQMDDKVNKLKNLIGKLPNKNG